MANVEKVHVNLKENMLNKFNLQKVKHLKAINKILGICFHEKKSWVKPNITAANHILIIDPTLIGDIVMLVPFLRIIRKNNDYCKITLACGKWAETILKDQGLVDEFIIIDNTFLNSVRRLATDRKRLKSLAGLVNVRKYDYALEPRGDLRYIFFMHYIHAKRKVSYNYTGGECFLTDVIEPSDHATHLVEDKLYFLKMSGCKFDADDIYPRLEITGQRLAERIKFIKDNQFENKMIIGIHPGASLENRQWDYFDELLIRLHKELTGAVFVIFEGPGESEKVKKIQKAAKICSAEYMISKTTIGEYMTRVSACDVMICNDSGAGHIAAAYGVAVFVLFGPVFPEMVKPLAKENVFCFSEHTSCKPCMSRKCAHGKECLRKIGVDTVAKKVAGYAVSCMK